MDLYFSDQRQNYNKPSSGALRVINDNYYLIYGVKISSELHHDMIDFIVESGEWEGEIMEFVGCNDWDFFDTEGRSKPDRYEWLEGFFEDMFGFKSIINDREEDILFIGTIIWSTKNIDMNEEGCEEIPLIPEINVPSESEKKDILCEYERIKSQMASINRYWSDNIGSIKYYWIRGSATTTC